MQFLCKIRIKFLGEPVSQQNCGGTFEAERFPWGGVH